MKFFRTKLGVTPAVIVALIHLSACSDDVPVVTDAEILAFLGNRLAYAADGTSPTIDSDITECARLLAGLKDEFVADLSADIFTQFKTQCQRNLAELVNDTAKNKYGFKLKNFEDKNFVIRLTTLKNAIDVANSKVEVEVKAKIIATERLQAENDLAKFKSDYKAFCIGLADQFRKIDALCDAFKGASEKIKAAAEEKHAVNAWGYSTVVLQSFHFCSGVSQSVGIIE